MITADKGAECRKIVVRGPDGFMVIVLRNLPDSPEIAQFADCRAATFGVA